MDGLHLAQSLNQTTESHAGPRAAEATPSQPVPPPCQLEAVELVHITGDQEAVYCLTQRQVEELIRAEAQVMGPLEKLEQAIARQDPEITRIKSEVWDELKALGVLPTSNGLIEESLYDLEVRAAQLKERHQRALKSFQASKWNIQELRRIIKNALLAPETYRFYTLHLAELEQDHQELQANLKSLEAELEGMQKLLKPGHRRGKVLWAAVEMEVDYRKARLQPDRFDPKEIQHKQEMAVLLTRVTGLMHYVGDQDLETWARNRLRLEQIDQELSRLWGPLLESKALVMLNSLPLPAKDAMDPVRSRMLEQYDEYATARAKLLEERDELEQQWQSARQSFLKRVPATDIFHASGIVPRNKLVEIKRSGAGGFRYLLRDVLDDLRRQWARIDMAKVKAALRPTGIKGAAQRTGAELNESSPLKLRFAQWQSKEDHFLNLLNIELFKFDLNGETHPAFENFSIGAEAQMFRFAANAEAYGLPVHTATKRAMHLGAKVDASYSILEARATASLHLPSAKGWPLRLSYTKHGRVYEVHFGYLRTEAKYSIQGFAGASLMLAAEVHVETSERQITLQGCTKGEFFVGGTLKNEVSFAVQWSKPEHALTIKSRLEPPLTRDFKDLAKVSINVAVSFGMGTEFDFAIGLKNGKLVFKLKGRLVLGPGGGGGVAAELNVDEIIELIKFVRLALERSDFRFLEWISEDAFKFISLVMRLAVAGHWILGELVVMTMRFLQSEWNRLLNQQDHVKTVARNVLTSSELQFLTPESKASILKILSETFVFSKKFPNSSPSEWLDNDEEQAAACMKILNTVTNRRELVEILYRMKSTDLGKRNVIDFVNSYKALFDALLFQSSHAMAAIAFIDKINFDDRPDIE